MWEFIFGLTLILFGFLWIIKFYPKRIRNGSSMDNLYNFQAISAGLWMIALGLFLIFKYIK